MISSTDNLQLERFMKMLRNRLQRLGNYTSRDDVLSLINIIEMPSAGSFLHNIENPIEIRQPIEMETEEYSTQMLFFSQSFAYFPTLRLQFVEKLNQSRHQHQNANKFTKYLQYYLYFWRLIFRNWIITKRFNLRQSTVRSTDHIDTAILYQNRRDVNMTVP